MGVSKPFNAAMVRGATLTPATSPLYPPGRAPDLAGLECFDQMRFVDDAPAGTVDDFDAVLHRADRVSIDDVFGLRRERRVNRDDVRAAEEIGKAHHLDAHFAGPVFGEIR